ncbi:MAG: AEC family transporter [Anaerolineales bacterium]|nr:AEC family transporter [Anaerolineales bacterium]
MSGLIPLFNANLLPILITAGLGYLLSKTIELSPKTVSRITFYLFSPALVFQIFLASKLTTTDILRMVAFALTASLAIGLIAYILAKIFRFNRKLTIVIVLTTLLVNAGNYGLSLNEFAFGQEALAFASIYFVCSSIMVNTFGVLIASMGKASISQSVLNIFKFPALYALIIAIILNQTGTQLPLPLDRSLTKLAGAAIPAMLVLLGMQLGHANLTKNIGAVALAVIVRMVVSPFVALGLSHPFGLEGPALQAGVTETSMPTAVMTTILSTEFDVDPSLVSTIVTITTLVSPLTLTPLIAYLGS